MIIKFKNWKQHHDFFKKIPLFFASKIIWIFIILLIFSIACLAYIWYFFVFNAGWSEGKKQEYLNTHGKEVILDEKKFNSVIAEFSKRKENQNFTREAVKNIFQLN